MFEREIRLFRFMLGYLQSIVKDLDESQLTVPLENTANPPAWVLAHLAIVNDTGLRIFGEPSVCPRVWHVAFGMGKKPSELTIPYPSKTELMEKLTEGHGRLCAAAAKADPTAMNQPHAFAPFKGSPIETVGDIVAHLLTTHFASHVGQLSVMRRQLGFTPIF